MRHGTTDDARDWIFCVLQQPVTCHFFAVRYLLFAINFFRHLPHRHSLLFLIAEQSHVVNHKAHTFPTTDEVAHEHMDIRLVQQTHPPAR